jgi:hypothetical protein
MSTERDTHFQGAAKLQWNQIEALLRTYGRIPVGQMVEPEFFNTVQSLLTQQDYDLVKHVIENTKTGTLETAHFYFDDSVSTIPDLTEWPTPE